MSATARSVGSAGLFATSRRGGLGLEEIRMIEALRAKDRPEPWQALAMRFGRPVEDIRAVIESPRPSGQREASPPVADRPEPEKAPPPYRYGHLENRFAAMWREGVGVHDICRALHISTSSAKLIRTRLDLPLRKRGTPGIHWTAEHDEVIQRDYILGGHTATDVAKRIGVSRNSVIGRAYRLGLKRAGAADVRAAA